MFEQMKRPKNASRFRVLDYFEMLLMYRLQILTGSLIPLLAHLVQAIELLRDRAFLDLLSNGFLWWLMLCFSSKPSDKKNNH
jgi:hypothetical protein